MIALVVFSILVNIFIIFVETSFYTNLTILGFIIVIYIFPIICNSILSLVAVLKKHVEKLRCYLFPLISVGAYLVLGFSLSSSKMWLQFIKSNEISNGDVYIRVNSNLVDIPQVVFIVLLYFLVEFLVLKIIESRVRK